MGRIIDGVIFTPLKVMEHPFGDVYHGVKRSDLGFVGFGEAYFSTVSQGAVKAWKKHLKMTLNLVVPVGEIKFVVYDDRTNSPTRRIFNEVTLSRKNYQRLTVPPGVWGGFKGIGPELNLLLNVADMEHDPGEIKRAEVNAFEYDWGAECP